MKTQTWKVFFRGSLFHLVFTDRDVEATKIDPQRNKNFHLTSSSSINTLETIHFIIVISLFEVNQPCP